MAEKDLIHSAVRRALEKEKWIITDDPLRIPTGGTIIKMDMGAERVIAAERGEEKIAVEVKSLLRPSIVYAFYEAFGQYMFYRDALKDEKINRAMYLAISDIAYNRISKIAFIQRRIIQYGIKIIVVDLDTETVIKWIG